MMENVQKPPLYIFLPDCSILLAACFLAEIYTEPLFRTQLPTRSLRFDLIVVLYGMLSITTVGVGIKFSLIAAQIPQYIQKQNSCRDSLPPRVIYGSAKCEWGELKIDVENGQSSAFM